MKRRITPFCVLAALIFAGLAALGYLLFTGPRMKQQPHVRAFQARVPTMPAGALPVEEPFPPAPTAREAETLVSPFAGRSATAQEVAAGKAYYGYYCLACHGETGDGNGPVGESFVPRPSGLRSARVRAMTDGQILRAMLTGPGHAPAAGTVGPASPQVMGHIVLPQHRWPVVLYVRELQKH